MNQIDKVLFTAKVYTAGNRDGGASLSNDGRLNIQYSIPGMPGQGTNPEQLFAAGWSACYQGAMGIAARRLKLALPSGTAIDAEVDLCSSNDAYFLRARLAVHLPGVPRDAARDLIEAAHRTCPYSKAIRDNIDVLICLVETGASPVVVVDAKAAQR
jgi:Ohr subfamily peroxiredoxin